MDSSSLANPFIFGPPVRGQDFLDRRRELRRLVGQVQRGSSALVSAEPRMGKTSLLLHLQANRAALFGAEAEHLTFHYLDGHTFAGWDVPRFWREVLKPLAPLTPALRAAYERAQEQNFDAIELEAFFRTLDESGRRLVLLLDEFGSLQREPGLHQRAFYAPLRSLASLYASLSLIFASRRSITDLNYAARNFAGGSPYFNFAQEVTPRPFPQKDVTALLERGCERFSAEDREFLCRIAGSHPYFLQAAAYYLWDAYEEKDDAAQRRALAGREFFASAGESVLNDIWRSWTPYTQMAFTLAALDAMPVLLEGRAFDLGALLRDLPNLSPELRKLERRGFLRAVKRMGSGYTPQAEVMLWYLAEELTRVIRPDADLKDWLVKQQWDGLLKKGEKDALRAAFEQVGGLLREGASAFIQAAAEGAGRALVSR